jgi:hypothetical protein
MLMTMTTYNEKKVGKKPNNEEWVLAVKEIKVLRGSLRQEVIFGTLTYTFSAFTVLLLFCNVFPHPLKSEMHLCSRMKALLNFTELKSR